MAEPRNEGPRPDYPAQILRVLEDELGLRNITSSGARKRTYHAGGRSDAAAHAKANWSELHVDYFEFRNFVFTAVLYTGEEEEDSEPLVGGETGFADALEYSNTSGDESTPVLTSGLVVEPARGRIALFSGGGENYHSPLAVVQGRRSAWNIWFKCDCEDGNEDPGLMQSTTGSASIGSHAPSYSAGLR